MENEKCITNMINWAKEHLGIEKYAGWCLDFIEDALEQSSGIEIFGGDSAKESCEMYKDLSSFRQTGTWCICVLRLFMPK